VIAIPQRLGKDGQMDGQTDDLPSQYRAPRSIAL